MLHRLREEGMQVLWYKLKTWYGGEEALVKEIRRTVPPYLYEDVFVIYNERDVRRQERVLIEQKPLFRGCAFLTCKDTETESLFRRMEKVPALSKLIATGYLSMFPLMEKDAEFLETISGKDHVVRASYVLREQRECGGLGGICGTAAGACEPAAGACGSVAGVCESTAGAYESATGVREPTAGVCELAESVCQHSESTFYRVYGPLEYLMDGIEKIRFSSRFAKTHKMLWGEDTVIPLGILLDVDVNAETFYNGTSMVTVQPTADHYTVLEVRKDETGKNYYRVCETVTMLSRGEGIGVTEFGKKTVEETMNQKIGVAGSRK